MQIDVLEQYRSRLPKLFTEVMATLEAQARGGDNAAHARLVQILGEPIHTAIALEGEGGGEFFLRVAPGGMSVVAEQTATGFGHALGVSVAAARHGLRLLDDGEVDALELAAALSVLASPIAREEFGRVSFAFELEVPRVPVLGTVRAKVCLGRPRLAKKPEFKLTVDYDELEDAREQGLGPHQLFLAGKVRIDGDVAKAMLLGMTLAQLR
jgi:hypothetical protein